MRRLLLILFVLTTSLTTFQSVYSKDKNKQIRMSLSGIWNGERNETNEDYLDESGPVSIYTVDRTCLRIKHYVFKGNYKNVTIQIFCSDGSVLLTKKNVTINGKYKLPVLQDKYDTCTYEEEGIQNIISVTNINGDEIYRCEITGRDCEV